MTASAGPPASMSPEPLPAAALLEEIEAVALELARYGGGEIAAGLSREIAIEYKTEGRGQRAPTDPVSEVDRAIEERIRARLAERFPDHGIVGEEVDIHPRPDDEFLWVVDPIDGTTNYINGFPLFACSIAVLHRGRPVVGAIWCSTGHALDAGVYHSRLGGALGFEGAPFALRANEGIKRRLAATPGGAAGRSPGWDYRVTGSIAIECAFVAAGLLNSAAFYGPGLWDVAAGVALVRAAGLEVWSRGADARSGWSPLERFEAPASVREDRAPTLRDWRRPLLLGEAEALRLRSQTLRFPSRWRRFRRWLRQRRGR